MPNINPAYMEVRLSGGASNSDPALSLGGIMSSTAIRSKTVTGISNITGVTVLDAPGSADGAGTLAYTASTHSFTWTPNGGSAGAAVAVTEDGRYTVLGSAGMIFLGVTYASLPGTDQSDILTVAQKVNELWDDIQPTEAWNGESEYRCVYLVNTHGTDATVSCKLYIGTNATGADDISIGLDPAGVGDGSSTGVAGTSANENAAPSPTVTFSSPGSLGSAISFGVLAAGGARAFWQKRTVPAATLVGDPTDTVTFSWQMVF